jgi:hypothetical protein
VTGDGNRVISASGDKTLKVRDLETGRMLRTLEGLTSEPRGSDYLIRNSPLIGSPINNETIGHRAFGI